MSDEKAKEKIKVKYASVYNIKNPKNPLGHERGIILVVREHEGMHASHKGYMWFDIDTAIDLNLIPKELKNENNEEIFNEHLHNHLIGTEITEKIYLHHSLIHRKEIIHLIAKIAHLIAAFETELVKNPKLDFTVGHSRIKQTEGENIDQIKGALNSDQDLEIEEIPVLYASDGGFTRYVLGESYSEGVANFRVIDPAASAMESHGKIALLCVGSDHGKIKPNPIAVKILGHYKKRIEHTLQEIIDLSK